MKVTALIAAAALTCGTAAFAQQQDTSKATRGDETAQTDQQQHEGVGQKMRSAMHKLGEKTRHAFHRAGDKTRQVAHRDHANDTRAMGGPGSAKPSRDGDSSRQARMDSAYADWQSKQDKQEHR
jgi:hypothetical protein